MRQNTVLALFIWAMVAVMFATSMPAVARKQGFLPQGCRCCYFVRTGTWLSCGATCCDVGEVNCCR
ncbi:unnamed protein product [Urochloa decumbens]|uniref:Uncharacterized protein n=1 Tax=Urochloa decumbens TaxID=240449 RepID=A0ABC9FR70_9POAL